MYMWRFVIDGRYNRLIIFNDLSRHQEKIEKNALYEEMELCTVWALQTSGEFSENFDRVFLETAFPDLVLYMEFAQTCYCHQGSKCSQKYLLQLRE